MCAAVMFGRANPHPRDATTPQGLGASHRKNNKRKAELCAPRGLLDPRIAVVDPRIVVMDPRFVVVWQRTLGAQIHIPATQGRRSELARVKRKLRNEIAVVCAAWRVGLEIRCCGPEIRCFVHQIRCWGFGYENALTTAQGLRSVFRRWQKN